MKVIYEKNNWPLVKVSLGVEKQAQAIRGRRDALYTNIYPEKLSDLRWTGEVGELVFDWWLSENWVDHRWIQENVAGKPDFALGTHTIDIKTVKRSVPMREGYTAQVTARHAHKLVDWFFFSSYQYTERVLWLLGGISQENFLEKARLYKAGEAVHPRYIVRDGHEIYNISISELIKPREWLKLFI